MQKNNFSTLDEQSNVDIIGYINDKLPSLSRTQAKIASAILTSPRAFVEKPIEELAPWIGVSAPTITRFSHAIGCDGLRDLKLKIMGGVRVGALYLEQPSHPSDFKKWLEYTVSKAQNGIVSAMSIPEEIIEKAVEKILEARVIYAYGSGGVSNWLCEEIQNRFFRLGSTVVPCRDGIMQSLFAATARGGDVFLCCSLGGNNQAELEAIKIAQEYGGYCIALCPPNTKMETAVDLAVPVETRSRLAGDASDVFGPTAARYSMLLTIDLIAFIAGIKTQDSSKESLRRLKHQFVAHIEPDPTMPIAD